MSTTTIEWRITWERRTHLAEWCPMGWRGMSWARPDANLRAARRFAVDLLQAQLKEGETAFRVGATRNIHIQRRSVVTSEWIEVDP